MTAAAAWSLAGATALVAGLVLASTPPVDATSRSTTPDRAGGTVTRYAAPVAGPLRVVHRFDAPRSTWGPGHRGADLADHVDAEVLAPADGTVSFAGTVADRGIVTIAHGDGRRSSLEPVTPSREVGEHVSRGEVVGTVQSVAGHCAPSSCVHWGVREGTTYIDPLRLLVEGPVVLLPGP